MKKLPFWPLLAAMLAMLSASPSLAGPLNGHVDALSGFTGSVPFDDGVDLEGYIDFAVFTAVDFNANYAGLGYVPGDALVYTYQIESEGDNDITALKVFLGVDANTIGSFGPLVAGAIEPFTAAFDPTNAEWVFDPALDGVSFGLAYSSPLLPTIGSFEVFGLRSSSLVGLGVPVPGPEGPVPVPEPATILLLGCGLMIHARRFRRR
jgi:hypothetical protein